MNRAITFGAAILEATDQCMARDPRVYVMGLGVTDTQGTFGTTIGLELFKTMAEELPPGTEWIANNGVSAGASPKRSCIWATIAATRTASACTPGKSASQKGNFGYDKRYHADDDAVRRIEEFPELLDFATVDESPPPAHRGVNVSRHRATSPAYL